MQMGKITKYELQVMAHNFKKLNGSEKAFSRATNQSRIIAKSSTVKCKAISPLPATAPSCFYKLHKGKDKTKEPII